MNIIHRDIKTENVMINKDGRLKIMDFGLGKNKKQRRSHTNKIITWNSFLYVARTNAGNTCRSQKRHMVLGVVFYEILTGELPFKSEHEAALLYLISSEQPALP